MLSDLSVSEDDELEEEQEEMTVSHQPYRPTQQKLHDFVLQHVCPVIPAICHGTCSLFLCKNCAEINRGHIGMVLPDGRAVLNYILCTTCVQLNCKVSDLVVQAVHGEL